MDVIEIDLANVRRLSMGGYILPNAPDGYPNRFEKITRCDTPCISDPEAVMEKRTSGIIKKIRKIN